MRSAEDNKYLTETGLGTPMGGLFRSFWIPALLSEELPAPNSTPVRVRLLGEDLIAFRDSSGEVGLLDEYCPHRSASLYFGRNEDNGLRCIYHGWKFDRTGRCVDMPNEPAGTTFINKVQSLAYPTRERGGVVWAYLGPPGNVPELPQLEWSLVPDENRYITKVRVDCNYLQAMEGDIDSSHSAFLHSRVGVAEIDRGSADSFRLEQLRKFSFADKAPKFFLVETDYGFIVGARRHGGRDHWYWRITQWMLPAYSLIPREAGSVLQCNMRVPIDDSSHWFFRTQFYPSQALSASERYEYERGGNIFQETILGTYLPTQNLANDFNIDRSLQRSGTYSGIRGIPTQDQAVTLSMGKIVNRTRERLGTSDLAIINARRMLMKTAQEVEKGAEVYAAQHGDVYAVRAPALLLPHDTPFDVGATEAINAGNPWVPEAAWAQVEPVVTDA
jgi:phthalate 4,5-dioxygenase oxygenase subunit